MTIRSNKMHKWNPPIWLENPVPETMLVHDEPVEVYEGFVSIKEIKLYRKNDRTTLDLDHLLEQLGKTDISALSDDEIISFILQQGLHKIQDLSKSIKKNGVKVPLILTFDKELIDGNRRFLGCQYLLRTVKPEDEKFTRVLARSLPPKPSAELRLKLISEENFLPDYKEPWPREVRAKFAVDIYEKFLEKHKDEDEAYKQVKYFLEISKQDLQLFREVLRMIDDYVKYASKQVTKDKQVAEIFARKKFHFFEEFYNKTRKGLNPIKSTQILKEADELLYKNILDKQLSSTIRVRELAEIVRYEPTRRYLQKPNSSFEKARAIFQDYSRPKKAGLKIIHFCDWIEVLANDEKKEISSDLKDRLYNAATELRK